MDLTPLIQPADTKILLVVMDGLGGYADADHGTELEEATTPHLDQLVREGTGGMSEPVGPGITPGSGPGHLVLFGYDPEQFELGRGALSAAGLDFELRAGDVAARGNLATLDAGGAITDRRAGRIPEPEARVGVDKLQAEVSVPGIEVSFRHEREHRVLVVLRGTGLDPRLGDTDPQHTGVPPLSAEPLDPQAKRTADLVADVDAPVRRVLAGQPQAAVGLGRGGGGAGAARARGPAEGERRALPRLRHTPRAPGVRDPLRAPRRRGRHLPHVPRHRPAARHGGARPPRRPRRAARRPARRVERLRLLLPAPQVHRLGRRGRRSRPQDPGDRTARRSRAGAARTVTGRDRGERRPLDAVTDGGALVAPRPCAAVERALRARRSGAVRGAVVQSGRPRAPPHQGPDGVHARECRPPPEVRRLTRRAASAAVSATRA